MVSILLLTVQENVDFYSTSSFVLISFYMDPKVPSMLDTTVDSPSQMKTDVDFLAQAGQVRTALEQLSSVLGWNNPSEPMIVAALEQIMKSIVSLSFFFSQE
jgi:hypothetical protein